MRAANGTLVPDEVCIESVASAGRIRVAFTQERDHDQHDHQRYAVG